MRLAAGVGQHHQHVGLLAARRPRRWRPARSARRPTPSASGARSRSGRNARRSSDPAGYSDPFRGYGEAHAPPSLDEQITKYLTDAHSIEEQALAQMERAPAHGGRPRARPRSSPSTARRRASTSAPSAPSSSAAARSRRRSRTSPASSAAGAWSCSRALNPDTPGKLAVHAYAYEHMELAAYELLRRMAERAGDEPVRALAEQLGGQERAMADRIAERWDRAVDASLREKAADDLDKEVVKYLRDAHAIEAQAIQLLETGPEDRRVRCARGGLRGAPRADPRAPAPRRRAPRQLGSGPGALPGRRAARRRAEPRRLLQGPARHAGQARGLRVRVRGAGGRRVRDARAHRRARGRHDDRQAGAPHLGEERHAAEKVSGTWDAAVDTVPASACGGLGRDCGDCRWSCCALALRPDRVLRVLRRGEPRVEHAKRSASAPPRSAAPPRTAAERRRRAQRATVTAPIAVSAAAARTSVLGVPWW